MVIQRALESFIKRSDIPQNYDLQDFAYLMEKLGDPQNQLKIIHVAGTNGKGSTGAMITSVLQNAGYKVGFFCSPHVVKYNERIRINNQAITDEDFLRVFEEVKSNMEEVQEEGKYHYTIFEVLTAVAYLYFYDENVDFAVMEVGIGGRLDATNLIEQPLISVITPIALDHLEMLGSSIESIATEKAGIIKKNSMVVSSSQTPVVKNILVDIAKAKGADIVFSSRKAQNIQLSMKGTTFTYNGVTVHIPLLGLFQVENAITALTVINILRIRYVISKEAIVEGLKTVEWYGRMEKIMEEPVILIDGGHNVHGTKGIKDSLELMLKDKKILAIMGIQKGKDFQAMIDTIAPICKVMIATEPISELAIQTHVLAQAMEPYAVEIYEEKSYIDAVKLAVSLAEKEDVILAFGSFYLVGSIKQEILSWKEGV